MTFHLEQLLPDPLADQEISASQIWKKKAQFTAGKCIRLNAASGKGKTTLIHILYGRRTDYSGNVTVEGKQLRKLSSKEWAELRQKNLSIVFQEMMLFPELSGWENIMLKLALTNHYPEDVVKGFSERINAGHLLKKKCGTMSFGERQRIAILRCLVQPFDWLLLDEPFSHLDNANSYLASALITEECKKRNAGIIITALGDDDFFNYDETFLV